MTAPGVTCCHPHRVAHIARCVADHTADCASLQDEIKKLKTEIEELKRQLKQQRDQNGVLRTDKTSLQDEVRELKKQLKPIDPNKALQVSLSCLTG